MQSDAFDAFLTRFGPSEAFETLADLLPDAAVFAVDAERNVVFWSDGAERLLGFAREDVLGRLCLTGIRCRNCMLGCGIAKHGTVNGFPLDLYRADEKRVPTRKYARAFRDERGEFAGGIEVLIGTGAATAPARPAISDDAESFHGLNSRDPAMLRAFQTIRNLAETDASVLVRGESGTGKELVARAIHAESHRSDRQFVAVNCAALTPSLIESELFGHVKGAFTGAVSNRDGLFVQADGGTLFLDEIAELPLDAQSKLLRVLEEHRITPVGGTEETSVDVRVIAATHKALRQEVKRGAFREDLMYRLRVVPIFLPPLRERVGDLELLLRRFLEQFNESGPRHVARVEPDAMRALLDHSWPGNVRELRNVVEYAFAVGRSPEIQQSELPPELRDEAGEEDDGLQSASRRARPDEPSEKVRIERALAAHGGAVNAAAASLGMSRATFWRKRKKHGLA